MNSSCSNWCVETGIAWTNQYLTAAVLTPALQVSASHIDLIQTTTYLAHDVEKCHDGNEC
jgi:hypothetical protein